MISETGGKGNLICCMAVPGKPTWVGIDLHHWIIELPAFPAKCSILAHEQVQRKKCSGLREMWSKHSCLPHISKPFSGDFRVECRTSSQLHESSCHTSTVKIMQKSM